MAIDFAKEPIIVYITGNERSIEQNRYYWGVVLEYIQEKTGLHSVFLHLLFKENFIAWLIFQDDFELSTKNLTIVQMSDNIEWIRNFATDFLHCEILDALSVS